METIPRDGKTDWRAATVREWLGDRDFPLAVVLWGLVAATLVPLARALPARTFFVGDPGVKLIAARNALEHPARPLDIDLPVIGGHSVDLIDPFFQVHGDHAHATASELFPLVSAPLIAAFGIRGAFILPALGFLSMLAATPWLGVTLDRQRSRTLLVLVTAACTPLLFYALEFWEHALAVGIGALATALFVRQPRADRMLLASGVLLGIAVLLRPEAAWYSGALLLGSRMLPARFSVRNLAVVVAGAVIVQLPLMTYWVVHSGRIFGAHVTTNLSVITHQWLSTHIAIVRTWLIPQTTSLLLVCLVTVALALGTQASPAHARGLRLLAALSGVIVAFAAARRSFPLATVWCAAPVAALSAGVPLVQERSGRRFLLTVAFVSSLLVALTAPNDGGGQWGPRYLLFAFIPVAILTADALEATIRSSRSAGIVTIVALVMTSLFIQRHAYKELGDAKRTYERIVQFVERRTPSGGYIVTDLWWLDQVTAALYPTRVVLFVDTAASARRALALLAAAAAPSVSVVRSTRESSAGQLEQWFNETGLMPEDRADIPERTLTIYRMRQARR